MLNDTLVSFRYLFVSYIMYMYFKELEPSVGEVLCRMFEDDLTIDLSRVERHLSRRSKSYSTGGGGGGGGGGDFSKRERFD